MCSVVRDGRLACEFCGEKVPNPNMTDLLSSPAPWILIPTSVRYLTSGVIISWADFFPTSATPHKRCRQWPYKTHKADAPCSLVLVIPSMPKATYFKLQSKQILQLKT